MVSEVLFPEAGRQEMDLEGGMSIDALEDIYKGDIGMRILQAARCDQAGRA
jgi:hypothetical protein